MALTNVWLAGYGGSPPAASGATAVWLAPNDGTIPSATLVTLVGWDGPVADATPIWIAGYGGPPPAAIGAIPICISGWGSSGGGSGGGTTSVWSAADAAANGMTLSNGGSSIVYHGSANWVSARGTVSKSSGKVYVEFRYDGGYNTQNFTMVGLASSGFDPTSYVGTSNYSGGYDLPNFPYVSTGFTSVDNPNLNVVAIGDVIGLAVDFTAQKIWFSFNNAWNTSLARPGPRDPAAGTFNNMTFVAATVGALFPTISLHGDGVNGGGTWTLQAAAASQKYAPPAGFSAWDGGVAPPPTSVWSSSDATANGYTLSNGGLTFTNNSATNQTIRGTVSHSSGKFYVEFLTTATGGNDLIGVADAGFSTVLIGQPRGIGLIGLKPYSGGYRYSGNSVSAGFTSNYSTTLFPAAGDVWAQAIDFTTGNMWIAINNVWINSSNPATGTLPMISFVPATVGSLFPAITTQNVNEIWTLQATAASQKYAPPAGFSAWDSAAPVVTGHRYWRLSMTATAGAAYSMAEVQFRTTAGTPLLFSGGTASASSFYDSTTTADKATDNDVSTIWSSTIALAKLSSNTWTYDYGVGKALSVVEIMMQARIAYPNQTPTVFTPQWSDDGVNWTSMGQINTAPWTDDFQIQTFPVRTPAQAYLARTVGGNEGGNGANITALIDGLVSDGVWAKLDALYVLAQQNQSDARLNLISASYSLTSGLRAEADPHVLTFTSYVGFSGFANGMDTGFNPASATSPNFSRNNASLGVWSYSVIDEGKAQISDDTASYIFNKFGGLFYPRVNDSVTANTVATSITSGLSTVERNDAANMHPYQNGVSAGPLASASIAIPSSDFFVGGSSVTGVTTQTLSAAFIGASLGAAGQLALYNRLRTYMTAVGVP